MHGVARVVAVTFLGLTVVVAPEAPARELPVEYDLAVELEPATGRLQGRGRLRWYNRSAAPALELRLAPGGWRLTTPPAAGGLDLEVRRDQRALAGFPEWTILELSAPVAPGSSILVELEFETELHRPFGSRRGQGALLLAQDWFPRVVPVGAAPEALGDGVPGELASFRVELTVPEAWVVGGTGVEVRREPSSAPATERVVLSARRVRDFAWCAAPPGELVVLEEEFDPLEDVPQAWLASASARLQLSPADLELAPVHLRILAGGHDRESTARAVAAARISLAWLGLWHGPYPHPQLTLLALPASPGPADGFAHPMFLGVPAVRGLRAELPAAFPVAEAVTLHGLARQLLAELAAPRGPDRATVDRGLAAHAELSWLAAAEAGRGGRFAGADPWARERLALVVPSWPWRPDRRLAARPPSRFGERQAQVRPGLTLRTLEGLVGERHFARAVRRYVERGRDPAGSDQGLITILSEISSVDLGAFADRVVRAEGAVDWAVEGVTILERAGVDDIGHETSLSGTWRAVLELGRRGEATGPVEVRLRWADGRQELRRWQADGRRVVWHIDSPTPLVEVAIDPDGLWALETRRADNYWRASPSGLAARWRWWLAAALQLSRLAELPVG